jgi:hypothetical protein
MGLAAMEPDLLALIRRAMQIQQDCQMDYEWDFAETYRRMCRHMEDSGTKVGVAKMFDYLSELDPSELTEYEQSQESL